MNNNVLIFKYSLIAYSKYVDLRKSFHSKLNEIEFFNEFQQSLLRHYEFMRWEIPNEHLCTEFLNQAHILCDLEAHSFMSDENTLLHIKIKQDINQTIQILNKILINNNYLFTSLYSYDDWRKFISIFCTFKEWTENIRYFENFESKNFDVLKESPIISLCHFN